MVSTENISQNVYLGNQHSMSIPCCIFRMGGAALVMSNRRADARRAKQVTSSVTLHATCLPVHGVLLRNSVIMLDSSSHG